MKMLDTIGFDEVCWTKCFGSQPVSLKAASLIPGHDGQLFTSMNKGMLKSNDFI